MAAATVLSPQLPAVLDDLDDLGEFTLDLRVTRTVPLPSAADCDTSDGCGSTCQTSACSTASMDPS
jgi:FxLD family lantipeptide